ncbi:flavodoxin family protein [Parolsenella catena]|uniref:flavodoxin family protein n=1 Tax=Parolsenella catena TaxID=2003188 RepID=UPI00319E954B
MNIVVLSGSPRKGANTDTMVDTFAEAAHEGGHTVEVVRVAGKKIAGCLGCQYCFEHEGACVQKDDMAGVVESLKNADMVVFASPIYWFDITAQEKAVIDRLYAFGATGFSFTKTALLLDSHSKGVYDAAIAMYKATCAYCKWEDQGIVTISGMTERDSMASSPKLEEVRELARKLA